MKRLLLVGGGHAHAQVLLDWIRAPLPGVELLLVTPSALAPYSGMVPGWLAGHYRFEDICIDFAALARAAGATLVLDEVVALDAAARELRLAGGRALSYELLSLNIGSTLLPPAVPASCRLLSLRPLGELRQAWDVLLQGLASDGAGAGATTPLRITMVGGGAAGVESVLAVCRRLRTMQPGRPLQAQLVTRGQSLLPGMAQGAARRITQALLQAGVALRLGADFELAMAEQTDLLLWATGAQAHAWPAASGLACHPQGFVSVGTSLQSTSHADVLAVGDCAGWAPPLPKAGVFAVRMGPVLSANLRAALAGQPLQAYTPQRRYLALLATADGSAIGAWGGLSAQGRWLWRWKDHIDQAFLDRFSMNRPR